MTRVRSPRRLTDTTSSIREGSDRCQRCSSSACPADTAPPEGRGLRVDRQRRRVRLRFAPSGTRFLSPFRRHEHGPRGVERRVRRSAARRRGVDSSWPHRRRSAARRTPAGKAGSDLRPASSPRVVVMVSAATARGAGFPPQVAGRAAGVRSPPGKRMRPRSTEGAGSPALPDVQRMRVRARSRYRPIG